MHRIQLEVDGYKRWLTNVNYEYFCPIKIRKDFYTKFLYKNFPFEVTDSFDLSPYNKRNVPTIKLTRQDKKLQKEAYQTATINNSISMSSSFSFLDTPKTQKELYYDELTRLRYKAKLDHGIIPNLDLLYDRYIKPNEYIINGNIDYKVLGGIFNVSLASSDDDDFWYEWLLSGLMKNGILEFYNGDDDQPFRIQFWDCYCIYIGEQMSSIGSTSMTMNMRLSPAITVNRGVKHLKTWKVSEIQQQSDTNSSSNSEESTQLLAEKLEGPFTTDGKKVEELIMGNTYIYKATKYNDGDGDQLSNTHWSVELDDDGNLKELSQSKAFKQDGVICYKYTPEEAENIRLYAWCQEASKDVSVKVPVVTFPLCVDRYKIPGLNEGGTNIAHDLAFGDGITTNSPNSVYTSDQVNQFVNEYKANGFDIEKHALFANSGSQPNKAIYSKDEIYNAKVWGTIDSGLDVKTYEEGDSSRRDGIINPSSDEELFEDFEDHSTRFFAYGEMDDNIKRMIAKFKRNEGGIYEDSVLSKDISEDESTIEYCKKLEDYIAQKIKENNGKIAMLLENIVDFDRDARQNKGKSFSSPKFDSKTNRLKGETIAINDVWATEVFIKNVKLDGSNYTINYEVTLWDHFGLDLPDMEKLPNVIPIIKQTFAAWFTLQHLRGYKPFITKIQFNKTFKGSL